METNQALKDDLLLHSLVTVIQLTGKAIFSKLKMTI